MYALNKSTVWKLVTIFFTLVAVAFMGYYVYRQRDPIIAKVVGQKINLDGSRVPNPSGATIRELKAFVQSHDYVEGMNIIRVDFRHNTRATTYRDFKDNQVEVSWEDYIQAKGVTAPLFTQNEATNQRIVNLINGQFSCVGVMDTSAGQLIPEVQNFSTDVCLVPIPPGYGDFIGFMNIFLKRLPTSVEMKTLETETEKLSIRMYERDIVKLQRKFEIGFRK